jgi:DNA polymerase I-like protein with 3'-5' exonuclease and polymerase domains
VIVEDLDSYSCPKCGERLLYYPCFDCYEFYCLKCHQKCECGQHPIEVDIDRTISKLPNSWYKLMISEGVYEEIPRMGLITKEEDLFRFVDLLMDQKDPIVYDVETNGLDLFKQSRIIGYAFYLPEPDVSVYIPVRHKPMEHSCLRWKPLTDQPTARKRQFPPDQLRFPDGVVYEQVKGKNHPINLNLGTDIVAEALQPFFTSGTMVLGYNIKFDKHATEVEGIEFTNPTYDLMLAAHLDDENEMSYEMEHIGPKYCGPEANKADQALLEWARERWGKNTAMKTVKGRLDECPLYLVSEYAQQDCRIPWQLLQVLKRKLKKQNLTTLSKEIATDYNEAIGRMERVGILVDREKARESIEFAEEKTRQLFENMVDCVGFEFNPGSSMQLCKILGLRSSNKEHLEKCDHPLVPLLQEWRQWNKAVTTYYRPWLSMCDDSGRVHPNIVIHGTVAGRCSCRRPNFQNLPRMDERTVYDVRRAIVARPGYVLLSRDMSQIELRMAAHYCEDPTWMKVYAESGDIHQSTADLLSYLGVTRQDAKTINFAMLYGMGADALSTSLRISHQRAKEILYRFRDSKPRLVRLAREVERQAREWGHIELWTGRRRRYPFKWMTHTALNNLIQGAAAEILRHCIQDLDKMLFGSNCHMILQIHDDILFELPEEELDHWAPRIRAVMDRDWGFKVPVISEGKAGKVWSDMVKIDDPFRIGDRVEIEMSYAVHDELRFTGTVVANADPKKLTTFMPLPGRTMDVKTDGGGIKSVIFGTDKAKKIKEEAIERAA